MNHSKTDTEYARECDCLSEIEADKTGMPHWGRWCLNLANGIKSLDAINVRPPNNIRGQDYWVELSRIGVNGESDGQTTHTWQRHLSEKNWISQKSIDDFTMAVKWLARHHRGWLHK